MYCEKCNKEIEDKEAKVCPECGSELIEKEEKKKAVDYSSLTLDDIDDNYNAKGRKIIDDKMKALSEKKDEINKNIASEINGVKNKVQSEIDGYLDKTGLKKTVDAVKETSEKVLHPYKGTNRPQVDYKPLLKVSAKELLWLILCIFGFSHRRDLLCLIIGIYGLVKLIKGIKKLYCEIYFVSEKFIKIKSAVQNVVDRANELNSYINEINHIDDICKARKGNDFADLVIQKHSKNGKNSVFSRVRNENVYECSDAVVAGASRDIFTYVCKYFMIEANDKTLGRLNELLLRHQSVEEGSRIIKKEQGEVLLKIKDKVDPLMYKFANKELLNNLGFEPVPILYDIPQKFVFISRSAQGKVSKHTELVLTTKKIEEFCNFLIAKIEYQKTAKYQRSLMTPALRRKIIERDHATCRNCGIVRTEENNLLLEIDHIKPVAKGGLTIEENLQTLCWKCNRKKSDSYEET